MTESTHLPPTTEASAPSEAAADQSTDVAGLERERLCLERLVALGEHTYELALDNIALARHEPDEELRAKLAAIGNRAGASWIKLYDKEREVRSRLASRR